MRNFILAALLVGLASGAQAADVEVMIAPDLPLVEVPTPDGPVTIMRAQDPESRLEGDWAKTARACPPFCIQPMTPAPGVTTVGELELLDMLADPEARVVDARVAQWYADGTIPGSIHIPYTQVVDRLGELGCAPDFDGWDCSGARKVALFCNGLWCGQSPTAIRAMLAEGYPADRIFYYRGGMQAWRLLGLTVVVPGR